MFSHWVKVKTEHQFFTAVLPTLLIKMHPHYVCNRHRFTLSVHIKYSDYACSAFATRSTWVQLFIWTRFVRRNPFPTGGCRGSPWDHGVAQHLNFSNRNRTGSEVSKVTAELSQRNKNLWLICNECRRRMWWCGKKGSIFLTSSVSDDSN